MEKISVVIITFNEESKIRHCIESAKPVADEIIVLDSFSNDKTVSIALLAGAVVYQQTFRGYKEQKNAALQFASYNYILSIDADEALSVELINSILKVKEKFTYSAYTMNRCNFFNGRFIRHGLWYPDKKIRLFDKRMAYWGGMNPHDKIILPGRATISHLEGDLFHYSFSTINEYIKRNDEVSSIAAQSLYKMGKKNRDKNSCKPYLEIFKKLLHKKRIPRWVYGFYYCKK
jgi:glycosyltransferase involved in cell wall biosynthesis